MNTGQMMLTICGLVLLSTLILNLNRNYDYASTSIGKNKFDVTAIEVGTAYLETIKNNKRIDFDQNTRTTYISDPNSLSAIGKDAGESRTSYYVNNFNDVDDFNNDTTSIRLNSGIVTGTDTSKVTYRIKTLVQFFDPLTGSTTSSKTFHKKVTVNIVSSLSLVDTFKLSTIISYWKFK